MLLNFYLYQAAQATQQKEFKLLFKWSIEKDQEKK